MDRNTIIATVLIFVIIVLWPLYMELFSPEEEGPAQTPISKPDTVKQADSIEKQPQIPEESPLAADEPMVEDEPPVIEDIPDTVFLPGKSLFVQDSTERFVIVETGEIRARISNRGGGTLEHWELKNYFIKESDQNVELITPASRNLELAFRANAMDIRTGDFLFSTVDEYPDTVRADKPVSLRYRLYAAGSDSSRYIEKALTIVPGQYSFDVVVTFQNMGELVTSTEYDLSWKDGIEPTEVHNLEDDLQYFASYAFIGDELEELNIGGDLTGKEEFTGQTHWTAIRSKYFAAFVIPRSEPAAACRLEGESEFFNNEQIAKNYDVTLMMPYKSSTADSFEVYLGPLEYDILKVYNRNFPTIMDFGWAPFRPISKGILWIFKFLHNYVPNYGMVLIVFAFIVKIVLYPLTHKSFVSMQKMKDLAPKIEEIRKKYKDEPKKLQQETFALYKKEKVNPLSGCIPLLFQMPILIPIYNVFYSTIELRGAGFIGWINDLSVPDTVAVLQTGLPFIGDFPVNPLPIIMTGLTFVQQRLTPMSAAGGGASQSQSQQKIMMYLMPLIFFFIFNRFPSGLVLYWTMYSLLTMIDQLLIARRFIK